MNVQSLWTRADGYEIDRARARLDMPFIIDFLSTSYWADSVGPEVLTRSIERSDPFGLYDSAGAMVGFARLVTDASRFAWLSDVFVVPDHRGKALGQWLVETIVTCPDYRDVGLWCLATRDAHDLYAKFGFDAFDDPTRFMVRQGGRGRSSGEA